MLNDEIEKEYIEKILSLFNFYIEKIYISSAPKKNINLQFYFYIPNKKKKYFTNFRLNLMEFYYLLKKIDEKNIKLEILPYKRPYVIHLGEEEYYYL